MSKIHGFAITARTYMNQTTLDVVPIFDDEKETRSVGITFKTFEEDPDSEQHTILHVITSFDPIFTLLEACQIDDSQRYTYEVIVPELQAAINAIARHFGK